MLSIAAFAETFGQINAFLVEMAAWEGQSGSPVFIRSHQRGKQTSYEDNWLIGMIQGFYPDEWPISKIDTSKGKLRVNMGLAIVIPADELVKALNMDVLVKDRDRRLQEKREPRIKPSAAKCPRSYLAVVNSLANRKVTRSNILHRAASFLRTATTRKARHPGVSLGISASVEQGRGPILTGEH